MPNDPRTSLRNRLRRRVVDAMLGTPSVTEPRLPAPLGPTPASRQPMERDDQGNLLQRARRRWDSVRNTMTGIGDDKVQAGRPDLYRMPLGYMELSALWRYGGHARRYVEVVPNDATRKGWDVEAGDGEAVDMQAEHKRLQLLTRVCEADTWGRLYGGAWLLMVVDEDLNGTEWANDPRQSLAQPLDLTRVRALQNLVVLDWSEVTPIGFDTSPRSTTYRQPKVYNVSPGAGGWVDPGAKSALVSGATVHASRMVYFHGAKLPPQQRYQNQGLDDSIQQSVWDQLRNTSTLDHSLAALAAELRITVLRMRDLSDVQVSDEADYFDYRMRELAKHRSVLNTVLLAEGEEYQHHPGTVTGMAELVGTTRQSLQAVTGMPEQLWIGNAPGGLSTDGESHRNLWANVIGAYQATKLLPLLEQIYAVIFAAKAGPWGGKAPAGWRIAFRALDELTTQGEATLRKTVAEVDAIYVNAGVLDPQHVARGRFGPKGWQFELPPISEDTLGKGAELDLPAVLAALAAQGGDPALLSGAQPGALPGPTDGEDDADPSLGERRRLAQAMTEAGVLRCEHGRPNRCPLCGVERRRELQGTAEDGTPRWGVRWAAIGDYSTEEPAVPTESTALQALGLADRMDQVDATAAALGVSRTRALQRLLLRGLVADRCDRLPQAPQALGLRADAEGEVSVWLGLPLPEAALPTWESTRLEAATIAGVTTDELELHDQAPHVTLLWVGKVPLAMAPEVQAKVRAAVDQALGWDGAASEHREIALQGTGLGAFRPSPSSEGATPMYLGLESEALRSLHEHLAAVLLDDDDDTPRHWYSPHATVGYWSGELTPDQWCKVWESRLGRGTWSADTVELRMGGEVVATWTLAGE